MSLRTRRIRTNHEPQVQSASDATEVPLPKLSPHEWNLLHGILLGGSSSRRPRSDGAVKSAKHRVGKRLREILKNQFLDFESCARLDHVFNNVQLERIGILHLVERACRPAGPSQPQEASTSSVQSSSDSSGNDPPASQHLHHAPPAMVIPPSSSSNPSMFMDIDDVDDAAVPLQHADEPPESAGGVSPPISGISSALLRRDRNAFYDVSDEAAQWQERGDFREAFAQLVVKHNLSVACATDMLHTLHSRKIERIDLEKLPRDSKSLTKVPQAFVKQEFSVIDISETVSRGETDCQKESRDGRNDMVRERAAEETGDPDAANIPLLDDPIVCETTVKRHYMHLGVESVCSLDSPGAVYRKDLIRVLKMAAAVCPQIRSEKLLAIIDPEEHEKVSNDPAYKASLLAKKELCEETIFWMDFNIDGITLFKSSKAPQGIPILCRLYGLGYDPNELEPAIVIPTDLGYVSLVGMYHGVDKPDVTKFVNPLLIELRQLHPLMPKMVRNRGTGKWERKFGVKVRGMICDAKERPWLKGTGKFNSYQGCERCVCDGANVSRSVRFICMCAKKRREEEWDDYLIPTQTSIEACTNNTNKPSWKPVKHRTNDTPFNEMPRPFNMVFGFPIDDMHNVGGGAALFAIAYIFGTDKSLTGQQDKKGNKGKKGPKGPRAPTFSSQVLSLIEAYTQAWTKPKEICRDPLPIRKLSGAKMRVAHNYITYMMIPLLSVDIIREEIQNFPTYSEVCDVADLLMCFVVAIHLICMTRHDSPSDQDIIFAEECLNSYVRGMVMVFGLSFLKYKNHCLLHLAAEAKALRSHMGGFNAFPFENFLGILRRIYVRSGKNVLKQVYNKLSQKAYFGSMNESPTEGGHIGETALQDDVWVKLAKEHGSLNFPQWTVLDSRVTAKGRKYVTCRGFELNLKYPDNIAVLRKETNNDNNNEDVIIVFVTGFLRDKEGNLMLQGREFLNIVAAHSKWNRQYHPVSLMKLGCYEASEGIDREVKTWKFADVRGKCFPFHMNLKVTKNPINYHHSYALPPEKLQSWVLIRLKHTCNAETLTARDVPSAPLYRKDWPNPPPACECMDKWCDKTKVGDYIDLSPDYFNFESGLLPKQPKRRRR